MVEQWYPVLGPRDPWDPRDRWDPPGPSGPLGLSGPPGIPRVPRDPEDPPQNPLGPRESPWDNPGTGISRDVMREKDFSEIIVSFLYLRNYNFSIIKIFLANTSNC